MILNLNFNPMATHNDIKYKLWRAMIELKFPMPEKYVHDVVNTCLAVLVKEKLAPEDSDLELHKAQQQLRGFYAAKYGMRIIEMISDMGLTYEEWRRIKQEFDVGFLTPDTIIEIDDYFKHGIK